MTTTYTHVAQKIHTGYRHVSNALAGHTDQKPGRRHAVNVVGRGGYRAVCGEFVPAEQTNEWCGDEAAPVWTAAEGRVTCKRCLARKPVAAEYVRPTRQLWAVIGADAAGSEEVYCHALTEAVAAHMAAAILRPREILGQTYPADYTTARYELRTVPADTNYCGLTIFGIL